MSVYFEHGWNNCRTSRDELSNEGTFQVNLLKAFSGTTEINVIHINHYTVIRTN